MESLNIARLTYDRENVADAESDLGDTICQTINNGLNDGGVLAFRLPPDPERFTDLNTIMLRLRVSLLNPDMTTAPPDTEVVCLDAEGMHGLFSSVEVRFNDEVASTMTNYPYTTALSRMLGCSKDMRTGAWDSMDGTMEIKKRQSTILMGEPSAEDKLLSSRIRKNGLLIGRIYADVLTSARQYLPPGVTLGINLRRAPDSFSLLCNSDAKKYFLSIQSASLYVKRLRLRPSLATTAIASARNGCLTFNRLECRMIAVPIRYSVFQWLDALNGAPLPNRCYIAFANQASVYGKLTQRSTYFENLLLSRLNFKLNGRDLQEPIKTKWKKTDQEVDIINSDAREGYLTVLEVLNQVSDQTSSLKLDYTSYLHGKTIYAIELGKCGAKSGTSGSLDIEFEFEEKTDMDGCIFLFTEKTEEIPFRRST